MHGVTGADESFMELAEAEAEAALKMGEVPVGCIFVRSGAVVARCVRVTLRLDSGAVVSRGTDRRLPLPFMQRT